MNTSAPEFLVACLCAAWCGTCRDYRAGFEALTTRFPEARFLWLDVEDDAELLDDYEVETFPTLLIQRHDTVLFFGTMLPHHDLLQRTHWPQALRGPRRLVPCQGPSWQSPRSLFSS